MRHAVAPSEMFYFKRLLSFCLLLVSAQILVAAQAVPQTIHLQSRVAPVQATLRRRALNPVTVPLADFFLGTDLQFVQCSTWVIYVDCFSSGGLEISVWERRPSQSALCSIPEAALWNSPRRSAKRLATTRSSLIRANHRRLSMLAPPVPLHFRRVRCHFYS